MAARTRVRKPVGRQPMASMRESQPELVWGPWRSTPPKMVRVARAAMAPVAKIVRPVRRSFFVSGCIRTGLVDEGLHEVDDDSGDGDVEPDGEGVAGQLFV